MNRHGGLEFAVGLFTIVGLLCFSYLAFRLGDITLLQDNSYRLEARFVSTSGLKKGAYVEVAGVKVGRVENIELDTDGFESIVTFSLRHDVRIPEDATASVRTAGLIGDKFLKLTPGGSEQYLSPGMEILETESAINLEELVSKYMFETDK